MQPGMCSSEIAALLSSQSKLQDVASMNYESSSFSRIFSTNDSMIAAMFLDFFSLVLQPQPT
jgi:prephenate dehydrogenase